MWRYIYVLAIAFGNKSGNICPRLLSKLSMASESKHLRTRGNVWWLHYRIPKRFQLLPECIKFNGIAVYSLETDSLREARRKRDGFIHRLEMQVDNHYQAWLPEREDIPAKPAHPFMIKLPDPNHVQAKRVLELGNRLLGVNSSSSKFKDVATREQDAVLALFNANRGSTKGLKALTARVAKEKETEGLAPKTVSKIRRSATWFLEHLLQDDIDIDVIDYDQVHGFILAGLDAGVAAGSTLKGHMYGLSAVWKRARQSKLVSGDNPFEKHGIRIDSQPYDPFTYHEIYQLYNRAEGELKTLIHAGATTGARIDEVLTAEVKTPSTFNGPCWLFKFKEKGKTGQSTRVVPVHASLNLPEGFQFALNTSTATKQVRKLIDEVLGIRLHELSGLPRILSFHSFRATVITELVVKHRINEKVVGAITGHVGGGRSKEAGVIRDYIHPGDLQEKWATVNLLPWKCKK